MSTLLESNKKAVDPATSQFATFYLGELLLGLPINQVQEINRHLEITPVPHAAPSINGVINLRGEVVTVIDLPRVLGLPNVQITKSTRNVVIHHEKQLVGLLVDDVADILSITDSDILPPPANVKGVDGRFFRGVYTTESEIVVVLNLDETLSA